MALATRGKEQCLNYGKHGRRYLGANCDIIDIKKEERGASLATPMTRRQFDRRPHTRLFISNPAHHPPVTIPDPVMGTRSIGPVGFAAKPHPLLVYGFIEDCEPIRLQHNTSPIYFF